MTAQTVRGCTKHVLRFYRRVNDNCRDLEASSVRPRNLSVPSYRPMQRSGSTRRRCPVRSGSGEEQHTQAVGDKRRFNQARERMSNQRQRAQGMVTYRHFGVP